MITRMLERLRRFCRGKHFYGTLILTLAAGLVIFVLARWILSGAKQEEKVKSPPVPSVKVAIIIDDWGYSLKNLSYLFEIEEPMTIAVLPNLPLSATIAEAVNKRKNFEIILHLPLEPKDASRKDLESDTIYTSMSKEEITSSLTNALKSIPYLVGVSNHMGSRAMRDRDFMKIIFSGIREQKLFFLDSLVTDSSVGEELSRKMKLRFAKRSIFFDNENDPEYIKGQLAQLVLRSKSEGSAIGIGHAKEITLKVLKEMIPQLEKQGIEFVYVSQLVK